MNQQPEFFPRWIDKIDVERVRLGLSIESLCREACVSPRGYYYLLSGTAKKPNQATATKLEKALDTFRYRQAS